MPKKPVNYRFEENTIKRLEKWSDKLILPASRIAEMSIVQYLDELEEAEVRRKKAK